MRIYLMTFMTFIILISCEKERNISVDTELISELSAKSYDTLMIESNKLVLDAYLWRDFMPISPSSGKRMISINWLMDIDSTKIPDNIDLKEQYVIYKGAIWISKYENESRPTQPEYKIEKISRDGPKWGPDIYVDVISKVFDSKTNNYYYIIVRSAYVERTD